MSLPQRPSASALPFLLLALLAGCGTGAGPADVPETRPSDGLLERPDLQALVAFQTQRDTPGLINALRSGDAAVRARAAFALGSVQAPEAVPALEALLDDTEAAVRRDVAFAIGQAGDPAGEAGLIHALGVEQDQGVRRSLIHAMGRAGGEAALAALVARPVGGPLWPDRTLAMGRLLLAGVGSPPAADSLASWLEAPDPAVRFHAAWFFARVGSPAVWARYREPILEALSSYALDDAAAMHLIAAVGEMGVEADTRELVRWLEQARDWRLRVHAARALEGRSQDPAAQQALLEALANTSVHVRQSAGEALAGERQPAPVVAAVSARMAANPEDWQAAGPLLTVLVRAGRGGAVVEWADRWPLDAVGPWIRAAPALAMVAGDAPLERLARASAAEAPAVASAALRALAARWPAERRRAESHETYWQAFSGAVQSNLGVALPIVAPVLADSAFVARGSVPLLIGAWERSGSDGDAEAATEVLAALGETGSPEAEATLRGAMAHPDPGVADAAAEALIALSGAEAGATSGDAAAAGAGAPRDRSAREREVDWAFLAEMGARPRLVLETDEGRVVVALVPEEAPVTVETVGRLAVEGRYDGVPFHRVVPAFVVQGGDVGRGDGTGGPGFSIPSELTSLRFLRGTAGMASAGKDTEGSQFFLTHAPQPHLDGGYTVFGWVVDGMDVVDRLVEGQRILRASIERGR